MPDLAPLAVDQPARVLAGLLGRGILESRTPWMHECEGDAQGLRLVYSLYDFSARGWGDNELAAVLAATERAGFAGLNVTFPFKQMILPLLDELAPGAAKIGAVNTVAFRDGRRIGYNTDVSGYAAAFRAGLGDVALGTVLMVGSGGAGSAAAHALLQMGAGRVVLFDADRTRADDLQARLVESYGADRVCLAGDPAAVAAEADGIVNATPVGMAKFPGMPIAAAALLPHHWVSEIIYFPLETALLQAARALGCRTLSGQGMAVGQAADAFAIFTGRAPDRARMADSFNRFVA